LPLPFAGLASQKNHMSIYLMSVYGPESDLAWFVDAWAATGKKLDMGKSCIRFKRVEDLALDVIGEAIRRMPVKTWIEQYERAFKKGTGARAERAPGKAAAGRGKGGGSKKVASRAAPSGRGATGAARTKPAAGKKPVAKARSAAGKKPGTRR
jgi:hypothetical protein